VMLLSLSLFGRMVIIGCAILKQKGGGGCEVGRVKAAHGKTNRRERWWIRRWRGC
jgi:hypothetical protein